MTASLSGFALVWEWKAQHQEAIALIYLLRTGHLDDDEATSQSDNIFAGNTFVGKLSGISSALLYTIAFLQYISSLESPNKGRSEVFGSPTA